MTDLRHVEKMWADDVASRALGMLLLDLGLDHARVQMTISPAMVNGHGIAHGGYLFTLADSAFSLACNSRGRLTVAAGADINFVAVARLGVIVAGALHRLDPDDPATADRREHTTRLIHLLAVAAEAEVG